MAITVSNFVTKVGGKVLYMLCDTEISEANLTRAEALASRREEALPDGGIEEKGPQADADLWRDVLEAAIADCRWL